MASGIGLRERRAEKPASGAGSTGANGVVGNERLTAITGVTLIIGLAVVGVTILRIGSLLSVHMFAGALLVGPLCLKLASVGYRLGSYYSGRSAYRRLGPPALGFRLLAPAVVLSTLAVFGTGGMMLLLGPSSRGTLVPIHKICFFVWIGLVGMHILGHLPKVARVLHAETRGVDRRVRSGRSRRLLALSVALGLGLILAILLLPDMSQINRSARRQSNRVAEAGQSRPVVVAPEQVPGG